MSTARTAINSAREARLRSSSRYDLKTDQMQLVGKKPMQGNFDIADANLVTAGDPARSILFYRISKVGRGRMPHIGSDVVDDAGVDLVGSWIRQMGPQSAKSPFIAKLEEERSLTPQAKEAIAKLVSTTHGALELAEALREGSIAKEPRALCEAVVAAGARA